MNSEGKDLQMIVERGMKSNFFPVFLKEGKKMEKRKGIRKRRMNKEDKLEREEKQPEGSAVKPLPRISIEKNEKGGGRRLKEMMNNKQC